jgi:putative ABC transport system permease protein
VIFTTYLLQILAVAMLGIGLGLAAGGLAPLLLGDLLRPMLPTSARLGLYPGALAVAAGFGLLTTLTFSVWPLGRARDVTPAALFRHQTAPIRGRPHWGYLLVTALLAAALAALAILVDSQRLFAAWFCLGAGLVMLGFRAAAALVTGLAARLPRPRLPGLRLALANLHRPGNATATVVLSLGLGVTVLVAIALVEHNFRRELGSTLPETAPAFFFIDIQPQQRPGFREAVLAVPGVADLQEVPSLRGRIERINGTEAEKALVDPAFGWLLRGDRGITYAARPPARARLAAGAWWPEEYRGPPLVSIYEGIAKGFGIGVGDRIGVNILGRTITAEVASVREINFLNLEMNFTLVYSPGVLEHAPQTWIATVHADPAAETEVLRRIGERFPTISAVQVREALATVVRLVRDIGVAVQAVGAITLLAGVLVLASAVAADHRRRVRDAVILKVLGATRAAIVRAYGLEYGLLGLITAAIAALAGTGVAWVVVTGVMGWSWELPLATVAGAALLCTGLTLVCGLVGTWRTLSRPAAPLLRNE